MNENIRYEITYSYYDKRNYRREKTLTCYNIEKLKEHIVNINKLENLTGEEPHVVMYKNGEAKVIKNLN